MFTPDELITLVSLAPQYRPVVEAVIAEFKEFYVPIFKEVGNAMFEDAVTKRIDAYTRFYAATGDEFIANELTQHVFDSLASALSNAAQTKGAK